MTPKRGNDIRSEFLRFFEDRGHAMVPGSSLLPAGDPTLLFTNAGMNQFKPIFLGTETRDYTRACNTQTCIRAGGKHNDLEDVGRDCHHHTLFEMLGNWSFGDYFKAEAIQWAWELLVDVWGLDPARLHATYFEGCQTERLQPDTESRDLWRRYLPEERIHPGGKKDNFWEMGEIGPCGPCSEIHYDLTDDRSGGRLVNAGDPRVIEIWNLVFIQFNRSAKGLRPLPARHVDTGMGLERISMVLQNKRSNYATDLFLPILKTIEELSGKTYGLPSNPQSTIRNPQSFDRYDATDEANLVDVAMRVIADHARALVFAVADGVLPSNEGRGYVLRSILRRAAGFGRQHLGIEATFLHRLVPTIVETFADAFPNLKDRQQVVIDTITEEEDSFAKTLDRGLAMFERTCREVQSSGRKQITGPAAFELHATYGFPITLTKLMAEKAGLSVDEAGFAEEMEKHRELSGAGAGKFQAEQIVGLPETDDSAKYEEGDVRARVLGWVVGEKFIDTGELTENQQAAVVLDRTNFYGESGGQVGDCGTLLGKVGVFDVTDAQPAGRCVLHVGTVRKGTIQAGQTITAKLCPRRRDTMRNHSATHLLNWALRRVLGEGADQAGSVVDPDRLRFDFTQSRAVTAEQLAEVERLVNERILADEPIVAETLPLTEAKKIPGVRAVFGEKYPDPVRVMRMGEETTAEGDCATHSAEFCGGTHLSRTGQVGLFKILSEESVAKGVRRITAVTGRGALAWAQEADTILRGASGLLNVPAGDVVDRIRAMQGEIKKLRKRPGGGGGSDLADATTLETPAGKVLIARFGAADPAAMRNLCDQQRQKGAVAVLLGAADEEEGKVVLIAMVSEELVQAGKLRAGDWVQAIAPVVGGRGGGKSTLAQAGGKDPAKLQEALAAAETFAKTSLG